MTTPTTPMAVPPELPTVRLVVADGADATRAWTVVRAVAGALGLDAAEAEAVALAAAELATNLARYAPGGVLAVTPIAGTPSAGAHRAGVQVESRDAGPGIADLARALQDGYSTGGGLGHGLPAVRRLMDEFEAETGAWGTWIVTRKWARPQGGAGADPSDRAAPPPTGATAAAGMLDVRIGGAGRPYPGETVSGDGWAVHRDGPDYRIAVVDGLGHGAGANAAARAALDALADRPSLAPADAVRVCHAALGGTRGAALAVARIAPATRRLTFASVGNVEARLWAAGGARPVRPMVFRGIVGAVLPTIRASDYALGAGWRLLLHTDGVSARFELDNEPPSAWDDPQALAETILERWGRPNDDATIVVATGCPDGPAPRGGD